MGEHRTGITLSEVNRPMLALILANLFVWLVGVPLILLVRQGDPEWLELAIVGAALTPFLALMYFFVRVLLWLWVFAFWYIQGCASLLGLVLFTVVALLLVSGRVGTSLSSWRPPTQVNDGLAIVALIVILVASFGLFSIVRRPKKQHPVSTPPVAVAPPTPQPKPLTYLDDRKNGP